MEVKGSGRSGNNMSFTFEEVFPSGCLQEGELGVLPGGCLQEEQLGEEDWEGS